MKNVFVICVFLSALVAIGGGYKILGIFPSSAKSHFIIGSALMKALAEKGHEVTVMIPHALKQPVKNYKQVPLPGIFESVQTMIDSLTDLPNTNIFQTLILNYKFGMLVTNSTFHEESVRQLLSSNETFDLIIMEIFMNEAMLGFGHHFKAPVVGLASFGASLWTCDIVGSPSPPSYVPNTFIGYTDHMTLKERVWNLLITIFERFYNDIIYLPRQEAIYNKYFADPKPSLDELRRNVSLVLLNTHLSLSDPRPYVPNMIEVGGFHISRTPKALPKDLQEFLDSATEGAVYFSMGSNLRSEHIPEDKRNAIINTLSSLKQKILWKWEDKDLPYKKDNMLIREWFPQDEILAHPNVKLFITHGGLLSTTEAVYYGVPIIGIPVFADQFLNMARAVKSGIGRTIHYQDLKEATLKEAVNDVLNNKKYNENMKLKSFRYRDQPMTPLDTAIYWIEYVIRHKGAPHMHSAGQDLNFIQYHNLDALAIVFAGFFSVFYLLFILVRKCILFVNFDSSKLSEDKKNI